MTGFAVGSYTGPAGIRRLSYEDGLAKLKGRDQKKLENNTYLVKVDDETLGVKLHNTIVVYIFKSGVYQYDTGGWRTVTTKDRINRYGPVRVHQANNIWYIGEYVFADGVRVNAKGKILDAKSLRKPKEVESKKRKLDKLVRSYVKGFANHVKFNGLDTGENAPAEQEPWDVVELGPRPVPLKPGPGDCWACSLKAQDGKVDPLGVDHLIQHMTEEDGPYFVPSLLYNAVKENSGNVGVVWHMIAHDAKRGDTRLLERYLTQYFRKRKPALLELTGD
jgi:hypothetical protein